MPQETRQPAPAFMDIAGACALLGVSRRRFGELRTDPDFPAGRLFGGKAALRFSVAAVLAWAEQQAVARFSTRGGERPRDRGRFVKRPQART